MGLGRVVLGHSDSIATDIPFITGLLARGVLVAFDTLGIDPSIEDPSMAWDVAAAIPQRFSESPTPRGPPPAVVAPA